MGAGFDLSYLLAPARESLATAAEQWKREHERINLARNRLDAQLRRVRHRAASQAAEDSQFAAFMADMNRSVFF
jgi:hypothetical protein